jgi:very-short-patch-repair endonuclease
MKNKTLCCKCDKWITNNNINRHTKSCSGFQKSPKKIRGVDFDPNWGYKDGSRVVWNKGKTKETNSSVASTSKKLSGKKHSSEQIQIYKNFWTEEKRKEQSIRKKELYNQFPEKHPNRTISKFKMSYPEKIAYDWLVENNIDFEHQKRVLSYYPDFIIGNIIIEIDGEQWHPIGNERDKIRDEKLIKRGYSIYRIRSRENIPDRLKQILGVSSFV